MSQRFKAWDTVMVQGFPPANTSPVDVAVFPQFGAQFSQSFTATPPWNGASSEEVRV